MSERELRELRKSSRLLLGEGQKIKTKQIAEEEVDRERIQIVRLVS